jgi:hypothetical protein
VRTDVICPHITRLMILLFQLSKSTARIESRSHSRFVYAI